ncbi:DNA-binding protein [Flavilitoribacter nigricans DSM 23189 = NBRC 102662]|uniref:DNA-binding protein n=1 Tax=Flavilitoribacter nigricans (strain ATCC 23147 / DSM 23189 / NBRC 102662 / NCIMB 1420 / SS-2) TaxID=1122177 RepID=A0A2D0MXG8_FLAN2|nr:DNA-binding protein [Flavilitoribacter nigricans DSM 23189 = NBRC 102662]
MGQIFTFVRCTLINLNFLNVDNERNSRRFESVYSKKVRAGKRRTYFFDVRRTKGDDFYLTLTESTKRFNSEGYERHKIFLYKEDFNRFLSSLEEVIDYVKTELMPEYDYDEYTRRHEEYEAELAAKQNEEDDDDDSKTEVGEDDMSW